MNYNTDGKLKLQRVPYGRLRKSEVAEYANRTLTIVEKHEPETLLIEPLYNLLAAKKPQIGLLATRYGIDPLRFEIEHKRSLLNLTISSLKLKVRLLSKAASNADLVLANTYIDNYLRRLGSINDKELSQRVKGFTNAVKSEDELKAAMLAQELMSHVEEIELAHTDYVAVIDRRTRLLSQRPNVPTPFLIASVTGSINDLFKAIEVAHLTNAEVDYQPVVDELNKMTDAFSLTVNLRTAYNKRKAEGEEGKEDEANNDGMDGMDGTDEDNTPEVQTTSCKTYVTPQEKEEEDETTRSGSIDEIDDTQLA